MLLSGSFTSIYIVRYYTLVQINLNKQTNLQFLDILLLFEIWRKYGLFSLIIDMSTIYLLKTNKLLFSLAENW